MQDEIIYVRRQWNDWRIASCKLSSIRDVHWDWLSGGIKVNTSVFAIPRLNAALF